MANLRRHGRRLRDYSPGDIRELACAWLRQHNNELMGEAQAICQELHLAELRKRELARQRRAIQKTQRQAQPIHQ
jgi:hypothetical protein